MSVLEWLIENGCRINGLSEEEVERVWWDPDVQGSEFIDGELVAIEGGVELRTVYGYIKRFK